MSIDYAGLFTKLGHVFSAQDAALTYEGSTVRSAIDTLAADYASTYRAVWDTASLYEHLSAYQDSFSGLVGNYAVLASLLVSQVVNEWQRQPDLTIDTA